MIRSSACQRQADPFPALSGRHGERRSYTTPWDTILFDAHWHGFRVFGGVPARGIYDNMRTAVDRVGRGKERQVNVD
ncbi:hypothetical protein ELI29_36440, partial [Rhizobium leguminosarum]